MHSSVIDDELREFLAHLEKDKTPIWKQMRCLEILAAVLAEELMNQGTKILMDPDEIVWPDKTVTRAPTKAELQKMKKNGKQHEKTKHGVFGDLVSKYKNASQAVEVVQEIPKSIPKHGRPCKAVEKKKAPTQRATKNLKEAHSDDKDEEENAKIDISKILLD